MVVFRRHSPGPRHRCRGPAALALLTVLGAQPALAEPTVAVFDFDVGGSHRVEVEVEGGDGGNRENVRLESSRQTDLLTNRLIDALVASGETTVVERGEVDRIMDEIELGQSDLADPGSAAEMGRLLGADYVIFGTITTIDPHVEVVELPYDAGTERTISMDVGANARLVEVETGQVEAAVERRVSREEKQGRLEDRRPGVPQAFQQDTYRELAGLLAAELIDTIAPLKVARQSGDEVYLARGGLSAGMRCTVSLEGEAITDPDSGEVLGHTQEDVAIVEVREGLDSMSVAEVVEWQRDEQDIPAGARCRPATE